MSTMCTVETPPPTTGPAPCIGLARGQRRTIDCHPTLCLLQGSFPPSPVGTRFQPWTPLLGQGGAEIRVRSVSLRRLVPGEITVSSCQILPFQLPAADYPEGGFLFIYLRLSPFNISKCLYRMG